MGGIEPDDFGLETKSEEMIFDENGSFFGYGISLKN